MKIAFLHHTYPGIGGTETVTNLLGSSFKTMGHEVYVLSWKRPEIETCKACFPVEYLPDSSCFNVPANTESLYYWLEKHGIDCLINQGPFWIPSERARQLNAVFLSVLHYAPSFKIENQRQEIVNAFLRRSPSLNHFVKSTIRYLFKDYFARRDFEYHFKADIKTIVENSDRFVVLAEGYIPELQTILGYRYDNLIALPNGLSVKYVTSHKEKTVVSIGRLTKWDKRVDRLLHIWKRVEASHPAWDLKILGDGPERYELERLAKRLGLQRCSFEGFVDVEPYLEKASILTMTSSSEGFPMVLLEAQAREVVPIAFRVSKGVEELIHDGYNGLLILPGHIRSYATQLSGLMNDDNRRKAMASQALEASKRYDIHSIAVKWIEIIHQIKHEKATANGNNPSI